MSSTASLIGCSDQRCSSAVQTGEAICPASDSSSSLCSYNFQYGDGSGTSGYYASDTLYFDTVTENDQATNSSATILFGYKFSPSHFPLVPNFVVLSWLKLIVDKNDIYLVNLCVKPWLLLYMFP